MKIRKYQSISLQLAIINVFYNIDSDRAYVINGKRKYTFLTHVNMYNQIRLGEYTYLHILHYIILYVIMYVCVKGHIHMYGI